MAIAYCGKCHFEIQQARGNRRHHAKSPKHQPCLLLLISMLLAAGRLPAYLRKEQLSL